MQEREQLTKKHKSDLAEATALEARKEADSNQFSFTVRGSSCATLSGSVPRSIFAAEPSSILNQMYNGDWSYAADAEGRAIINSDPAHWPLILNWLSFGTVTVSPTAAFLQECSYWQLDRLLAKLRQKSKGVRVERAGMHSFVLSPLDDDDRHGFILEGSVSDCCQRLDKGSKLITIFFSAYGRTWRAAMGQLAPRFKGWALHISEGPALKGVDVVWSFGADGNVWEAVTWSNGHLKCGSEMTVPGVGLLEMRPACTSRSILEMDGSVRMKLTVVFAAAADCSEQPNS